MDRIRSALLRNESRIQVLAWSAMLLPLIAFVYLTWQSIERNDQLRETTAQLKTKRDDVAREEAKKEQLVHENEALQEANRQLHATLVASRSFAGIRIQFYRDQDREVVDKALREAGFDIETRKAAVKTLPIAANAIGYGRQVSPEDVRDISVALTKGGLPLRAIRPSQKHEGEPKLVQFYASASAEDCRLLRPDDISAERIRNDREICLTPPSEPR